MERGEAMKTVILAGGFGTRLSEETEIKPKPMVEIGGRPILWHIMKTYSHYGFHEFIICLGYKGYVIKEYFLHYFEHMSDITVDLSCGSTTIHNTHTDPWKVTLVDTGLNTHTGGRIKRVKDYIGNETFMMTYGDGVSDVRIDHLLSFHRQHGKSATVTAVKPMGRFGSLSLGDGDQVESFIEKPAGDGSWINGGFFVLEPDVFRTIDNDQSIWERAPMERLAQEKELVAYCYQGFWKPMDTLRDKMDLESRWESGQAPWKVWA